MSWKALGGSQSQRRMHLLVSSQSARGRAIEVGPKVVRALRAGGWGVDVTVTTTDDDPAQVAEASPATFVGALGGDGYITSVATGVHRSGAVMVPMPGGRGNDLCRSIGVGPDPFVRAKTLAELGIRHHDRDPDDQVLNKRILSLDGTWVDDQSGRRRLALGVVSMGLDAWANKLANESWLRSGPLAYAYGAVSALTRFQGAPFTAIVDGDERDLTGWVLSVSNSGYFGGGINIVPSSDPTDGVFELVHVGPHPLSVVLPALSGVLARRLGDHPLIDVSPAHDVFFTGPQGMPAMADGDLIGHLPLHLTLAPRVVRALA